MSGRYQIVRKLGSGGMAEVFLGRLTGPGGFEKDVALKRIRPELLAEPDNVQLFLREARVAARLSHPNIVQVLDAGDDDGSLYLVMEYVDGGDLEAMSTMLRDSRRRLSPAGIAWVGAQVCEALDFMFELPDEQGGRMIEAHRDISSANVLVSRTGMVKLGDFGVVRLRQSKTGLSTVRGKWEYFPPEIVTDAADERGDVFALGITLYKLAAGVHPFAAATGPLCFERARKYPPEPIRHLPRSLWTILEQALAKDPRQRFQRAQDFGDALEDFLCTCHERMSPRLLAAQLFSGAAPVTASIPSLPASPSVSVEVDLNSDPGAEPATQAMERDELRRFEEIFGPNPSVSVPAAAMPGPSKPSPFDAHALVTAPEMRAAPAALPPDATDYDDLYARFIAMRPANNQASAPMNRERFRETLQRHRARLLGENPELEIVFDVVFQDGKPLVRPRASRRTASRS
jgi:serine/threonine protein kinase